MRAERPRNPRARPYAALLLLPPLLLCSAPRVAAGADPEAAARQYRIARRLAAEGSPDAGPALRKVVELDPGGALTDDALLEEALLEPVPRWPEELGRIDSARADRALALLGQVVDEVGQGDRIAEARYRRGLLRMEPIPRHDASAARIDLLTVATTPTAGEWADAARYAVAWLAEQQGQIDRARFAYQRLVVDGTDPAAVRRARGGLGRLDLRAGEYGAAARLLYEVERQGEPAGAPTAALKELAVRSLLGSPRAAARTVTSALGVRGVAGFAATDAGGLVVGDAKGRSVQALAADGSVVDTWSVDGLQLAALSPLGRLFAAAGGELLRLEPGQAPIPFAALGEFSDPQAMTADALGRVWVLDRRGSSIGRVDPGQGEAVPVWQGEGVKLVALRWDGRRLLGLDAKSRSVVVIDEDGGRRVLTGGELQRPVALAADASGRLAVLDVKAGAVTFYDERGAPAGRIDCAAAGIARPAAIDLGRDGSLHVFDEATTAWVVLQ